MRINPIQKILQQVSLLDESSVKSYLLKNNKERIDKYGHVDPSALVWSPERAKYHTVRYAKMACEFRDVVDMFKRTAESIWAEHTITTPAENTSLESIYEELYGLLPKDQTTTMNTHEERNRIEETPKLAPCGTFRGCRMFIEAGNHETPEQSATHFAGYMDKLHQEAMRLINPYKPTINPKE